ncbi:nuclear transport factor 2 family protein [Aquimarina brevivitae]|uniref:SnoaL-like protein n=1 Tax=Aquimarina brevivitae TaxID=323412 RepID=A0A4Q7P2A5_9FLAO|nr:nuclear transport factor 2 family protein [Aquimarina brevivitae]RZS93717.1 SnoaL-like protein [Aquimarina brevivitae]
MSNKAKEVVRSFYESDLLKDEQAFSEFLHPEVELYWNSSFGFSKKNLTDIKNMFKEMAVAFESLKCEISHILAEDNKVSIRYTFLVKTIEEPDHEEAVAHFISIWELRENQLYRGYQISQQGDLTKENLRTYFQ